MSLAVVGALAALLEASEPVWAGGRGSGGGRGGAPSSGATGGGRGPGIQRGGPQGSVVTPGRPGHHGRGHSGHGHFHGRGHRRDGFHGHRFHGHKGGGVLIAPIGPTFWWNPWWSSAWSYGPAPVDPPVYVQRPPTYWYYCPSADAYYPAVPTCPEPWVPVPAR